MLKYSVLRSFVYIWPGKLVHRTLNLSTISYSVNGVFNRVASSIHSCKSTTPLKSLSASWNSPVTYLNQNNMKYSITYCKKGKLSILPQNTKYYILFIFDFIFDWASFYILRHDFVTQAILTSANSRTILPYIFRT